MGIDGMIDSILRKMIIFDKTLPENTRLYIFHIVNNDGFF